MRRLAFALTTAALALSVSGAAFAQNPRDRPRTSGGDSGGGRAVPRGDSGGNSAPAPAPAPATSGTSGGSSSGDTGRRGGSTAGVSAGAPDSGRSRARSDDGSGNGGATAVGRPRDGRPVKGEAVERRPGSDGGTTIIVGNGGSYGGGYYGGGYYPWGYGGLGLGGYYGGLYDPWWYDDNPYTPYGGGYGYGYGEGDTGSLKLKIKPREASVYVDGYFAGRVDDYDGLFQRLTVESGPHRIEVRADGFDPLMFEVRILPARTITYKGELKPAP